MVLAYHIVMSFYGFWLPNDPRGSNSLHVRAPWLWKYGPATKTDHTWSVARVKHDHAARRRAKEDLRFTPVLLSGEQARAVARGFATAVHRSGFVIYACAIMRDHVHLVVARHRYFAEVIAGQLKGAAAHQLRVEGLHPMESHADTGGSVPSCWSEGIRKVYLNTPDKIRGRIKYVQDNPVAAGMKAQQWSFVVPYEG